MSKTSRLSSFLQLQNYGIYLIAFIIPLNPRWLALATAVIILEQIVRKTSIKKAEVISRIHWKNPAIWLVLFFLMHVVGMIYTENLDFAFMDLGMKSTFLIFPLFFILYQPEVNWNIFIKCFVAGAIVSILFNIPLSIQLYKETNFLNSFYGSNITHFMHRGYWAVYLVIAFFFMLKEVLSTQSGKRAILYLAAAFFIALFILLSGSKMGLILFVLVLLHFLTNLYRKVKKKWMILFLGVFTLFFIGTVYSVFPTLSKRVKSTIKIVTTPIDSFEKSEDESTLSRIFIWQSSLEIVQENFWLGVGTGDVGDERVKKYEELGYTTLAEKKYNSHNQFLNSHIALGALGSLLLLMIFVVSCFRVEPRDTIRSWRLVIVLILFLAMFTESMLETQAGIIPYAFLLCFLSIPSIFIPIEKNRGR